MSEKHSFPKLNDTNYTEWHIYARAIMIRKQVWDHVNGTLQCPMGSPNSKAVLSWRRKNNEAVAEITLIVEPSQLPHLRYENAAEI